jgi:hypothetical protein
VCTTNRERRQPIPGCGVVVAKVKSPCRRWLPDVEPQRGDPTQGNEALKNQKLLTRLAVARSVSIT